VELLPTQGMSPLMEVGNSFHWCELETGLSSSW